jgi:hypothetical protein
MSSPSFEDANRRIEQLGERIRSAKRDFAADGVVGDRMAADWERIEQSHAALRSKLAEIGDPSAVEAIRHEIDSFNGVLEDWIADVERDYEQTRRSGGTPNTGGGAA